jgi:EpsI family protein
MSGQCNHFRAWIVLFFMLSASAIAYYLRPEFNTQKEVPDFENIIPRQFGHWHVDENTVLTIINPEQQETLEKVYTQTLTRTYINNEGRRIMLSLAYGTDQTRDNRVHLPEVCYPAQGFSISKKIKANFISKNGIELPVMRLVAEIGSRKENITYWVRFGNRLVLGSLEQALARINFGLHGNIPDGLLFRVSEISGDPDKSYILQDEFINSLLDRLTPDDKKIMIGG